MAPAANSGELVFINKQDQDCEVAHLTDGTRVPCYCVECATQVEPCEPPSSSAIDGSAGSDTPLPTDASVTVADNSREREAESESRKNISCESSKADVQAETPSTEDATNDNKMSFHDASPNQPSPQKSDTGLIVSGDTAVDKPDPSADFTAFNDVPSPVSVTEPPPMVVQPGSVFVASTNDENIHHYGFSGVSSCDTVEHEPQCPSTPPPPPFPVSELVIPEPFPSCHAEIDPQDSLDEVCVVDGSEADSDSDETPRILCRALDAAPFIDLGMARVVDLDSPNSEKEKDIIQVEICPTMTPLSTTEILPCQGDGLSESAGSQRKLNIYGGSSSSSVVDLDGPQSALLCLSDTNIYPSEICDDALIPSAPCDVEDGRINDPSTNESSDQPAPAASSSPLQVPATAQDIEGGAELLEASTSSSQHATQPVDDGLASQHLERPLLTENKATADNPSTPCDFELPEKKTRCSTPSQDASPSYGPIYNPFEVDLLPKLEEFIPAEYFPDVLFVHDPDNVTRPQGAGDTTLKYRRCHPNKCTYPAAQSADAKSNVAHLYLSRHNSLGSGHWSAVYNGSLKLPPPLTAAYSPNGHVQVAVKLDDDGYEAQTHLRNEGKIYSKFPTTLMHDYCGYVMFRKNDEPVPIGPVVPKFFGYYELHPDEAGIRASSILLLENCGTPMRGGCADAEKEAVCSLFLRLHSAGFLQNSAYQRNMLKQRGPLTVSPEKRSWKTPSYRIIDFGRGEERLSSGEGEYDHAWDDLSHTY